jgi:hypothetical protein
MFGTRKMRRPLLAGTVAIATVCTVAIGTQTGAGAATLKSASVTSQIARLSSEAGFGAIDAKHLVKVRAVNEVAVTPGVTVKLPVSGVALADPVSGVVINPSRGAARTLVRPYGFGVITGEHGPVEFDYKVALTPGTTLRRDVNGDLAQVNKAGMVITTITAARAVDTRGRAFPASYSYDAKTHQLVVRANTKGAVGSVLIDPSWKCIAVASGFGALAIVAGAAWIFSDGSATWVAWALRAWFGLSFNAANTIAKACTL